MKNLGRIAIVLSVLVALLAVGTGGFHLIEGWSWFQALYATLMTVSTIGARPLDDLTPAGQAFNAVLIFLGVGLGGFAVGRLTHAVIESELGSFFGRRRMEKEISKLKDHFIICGVGRVGRRVAMEIAARHLPLVIIEKDPVRAQWAQERRFPVIVGDASNEAALNEARIQYARGLASAVTSDAQNVYIVLTARGLAPNLAIVARASEEDAESKLLKAGANTVISPYTFAGARMARVLTRPNVQRFIDLALSSLGDKGLELHVEELRVAEGSRLAGATLAQADIRERLGLIILAIRRESGHLEFNPPADQPIAPGDVLIALGDSRKFKELESMAGI